MLNEKELQGWNEHSMRIKEKLYADRFARGLSVTYTSDKTELLSGQMIEELPDGSRYVIALQHDERVRLRSIPPWQSSDSEVQF
jgi:hypothetical protein